MRNLRASFSPLRTSRLIARRGQHTKEGVLARDFIRDCLCGTSGYFVSGEVIGKTSTVPAKFENSIKGLPFETMLGEFDYRARLDELYKSNGPCWLTPSEIFAPWYGW